MTDRTYTIFARGGISITVSTTTVTETTLTGGKVTASELSARESPIDWNNKYANSPMVGQPTPSGPNEVGGAIAFVSGLLGATIAATAKLVSTIAGAEASAEAAGEEGAAVGLPGSEAGGLVLIGQFAFASGYTAGYLFKNRWSSTLPGAESAFVQGYGLTFEPVHILQKWLGDPAAPFTSINI